MCVLVFFFNSPNRMCDFFFARFITKEVYLSDHHFFSCVNSPEFLVKVWGIWWVREMGVIMECSEVITIKCF